MTRLILSLLMVLVMAAPALAQGSDIIVFNPGDGPVDATVIYNNPDGSQAATGTVTIGPKGAFTYDGDLYPDLPPGNYAATVSGTGPIVGVVNDNDPNLGVDPFSSYTPASEGGTGFFLPDVLNNNGFDTEFFIQNTVQDDNPFFTQAYNPAGAPASDLVSGTAPGNGFVPFDPIDGSLTGLGPDFNGVIGVWGNQPVSAVVRLHRGGGAMAYTGFTEARAGNTLFFPNVVDSACGFDTGLRIKLIGPVTGDVAVEYRDADGNLVHTDNMPSAGALQLTSSPPGGVFPGCQGSAVVTANNLVGGVVRAVDPDGTVFGYDGIPQGATQLVLPGLHSGMGDRNSQVTVQNVSDQATDVQIQYYDNAGTALASRDASIVPKGVEVFDVNAALDGVDVQGQVNAYVVSSNNTAAAATHQNANGATDSAAPASGAGSAGNKLYLPIVRK